MAGSRRLWVVVASFGLAAVGVPAVAGPVSAASSAPGGPGALSYFDLARKDCVGTSRTSSLQGLVHGGRRRAERRLVPHDRQHEREDAPVHRHGRPDVHRPPGAGHDVDGHGSRRRRDGVPGDEHGQERRLPTGDRLHHRPGPQHRAHEHQADPGASRASSAVPGVRALRRDGERQRRRRPGQRWPGQRGDRHHDRSPDRGLLRHQHHHERRQP